jgi:hypothetical protein
MVQLSATRLRVNFVRASLLVMATWPFAQHVLVTLADANPWKMMGFAMYCTPFHLEIQIWSDDDRIPRLLPPEGLDAELDTFARYRNGFGKLYPPTELGRAVMKKYPHLACIRIAAVTKTISGWTRMIETRETTYAFRRSGAVCSRGSYGEIR